MCVLLTGNYVVDGLHPIQNHNKTHSERKESECMTKSLQKMRTALEPYAFFCLLLGKSYCQDDEGFGECSMT